MLRNLYAFCGSSGVSIESHLEKQSHPRVNNGPKKFLVAHTQHDSLIDALRSSLWGIAHGARNFPIVISAATVGDGGR